MSLRAELQAPLTVEPSLSLVSQKEILAPNFNVKRFLFNTDFFFVCYFVPKNVDQFQPPLRRLYQLFIIAFMPVIQRKSLILLPLNAIVFFLFCGVSR